MAAIQSKISGSLSEKIMTVECASTELEASR
jgi:hypothetical protein